MNHTYKPGAMVVFGLIDPTMGQKYVCKITNYTTKGPFKYRGIFDSGLVIDLMPKEIVGLSDNVL